MSDARGLVGGRPDLRVRRGQVRPIEHPAAFDLFGAHADRDRAAAAAFLDHRPLALEIGFGRGHFLAALAAARPATRFLAVETRTRWCWSLLKRIDAADLDNVRVVRGDVRWFLDDQVPDGALSAVYLLFPDPWWKKRHHKKRLLAPPFLDALRRKLAPGASVWVKSDVPMTIELADEAFAGADGFAPGDPAPAADLPQTYREERCQRLGLPVHVRRYVATGPDPTIPNPTDPNHVPPSGGNP